MPYTQEQKEQFDLLLEEARQTYPDCLDYNLQVLCHKLVIDGHLDTEVEPEEVEKTKSRYDTETKIYYTEPIINNLIIE